MLKSFFENSRQKDLTAVVAMRREAGRLVTARGVTFLAMIFAFAAGYDGHMPGTVLGIALLACFVVLVRRHDAVKRRLVETESRLGVTEDWLARFTTKWKELPADGAGYLTRDTTQAADLNLYGKSSAFQYLCQARTKAGRDRLAAALSPIPPEIAAILARQEAVRELMQKGPLLLDLQGLAALLPDGHETGALLEGLRQAHTQDTPWIRWVSFLLPLTLFAGGAAALAGAVSWFVPGVLVLAQFLLSQTLNRRNEAILAPLAGLTRELHLYEILLKRLETESMQAPLLKELQHRLGAASQAELHPAATRDGHAIPRASQALHTLAHLMAFVAARRNLAFLVLGNALLLWDCHCASRFLRWEAVAKDCLADWLAVWADFELLMSLATPGLTRERHVFPAFLDAAAPAVHGTQVVSLLLPEDRAVPNDMDFEAGTCIVTGSNMSGKTTYLRTLALSAILAYSGAPVCAEKFALTPLAVYTSMRVTDDLDHGISTFYAELLRIKSMIEASAEKKPLLLCIDEIFKGTNSADRIVGARAAIEHLTRPWCITLVTTHDFELCDLRTPDGKPARNLHFEEHYEENRIAFDFRVKPGRCRTTNAKYLLRMAGILTEDETM